MENTLRNPQIRQGRFQWMTDKKEKEAFIMQLKSNIKKGFYFTDNVVEKIVDDLAPVFCESCHIEEQ